MYTTEFFLWSGKFPVACTAEIGQELSLLGRIEDAEHTTRDAVLVCGPELVDGVHSQGVALASLIARPVRYSCVFAVIAC